MNLESLTSKKIGGVPVLYVVLVLSAGLLYLAFKMKKTPTPTTPATDPNATPDVTGDTALNTDQPVFTAAPVIVPAPVATQGAPTVDTNDLWARRCIEYLTPAYGVNLATQSIQDYLNGVVLSSQEATARDAAIKQFGYPPESIPGTASLPAPVVATPSTPIYSGPASKQGVPPCTHKVKGTSDNTFSELAQLYYGSSASGGPALIQAYNPTIHGNIPVGVSIHIPAFHTPVYYTAKVGTLIPVNIAGKNGTTAEMVRALNPTLNFPVKAGTRVRVH